MSPPLYPHQIHGAEFLAKRRFGYLADEMRVGKTPQAIRACDLINAQRILVVCPAVARLDWAAKFEQWGNTKRQVYPILSRAQLNDHVHGPRVTIVSYDLFDNNILHGHWDVVILDEAHYLCNTTAKRTQAILGRDGVVHRATHRWFLSGTPATNHYAQLWPILHVFGLFPGSYEDFVRQFCIGWHTPYGFQITGNKNSEGLRDLCEPHFLRRKLSEVFPEMPSVTFSDYAIDRAKPVTPHMTATEVLELSLAHELDRAKTLDGAVRVLEANVAHVASLRRSIGMLKVAQTVELIEQELDAGERKIVVYGWHREVLGLLYTECREYAALVRGDTGILARVNEIERFTHDPNCRLLVGQIKAAGTAIDLSVADQAVFVEASWTPGDNAQAAMRLVNLNKQRPVAVRFLGLSGSIDEHVQRVLRRKTRELTALFG